MTASTDDRLPIARRHALVVLDMQSVFISPDGVFAHTTSQPLVDAVNVLTARCRDASIPVVHSRYTLRDDLRDAGLLADVPFVRQGHLCSSSPSSRIDDRIVVGPQDVVVEHHRPSAFFESDLESVLRALEVNAVVLAGVSVNNAIGATARDAFARDLPVVIARQAVDVAPDEDHGKIHLAALERWTAAVVDVADVVDHVTACAGPG